MYFICVSRPFCFSIYYKPLKPTIPVVDLTSGNVTSSYYLGGRLVATKENEVLRYVHQDHLTGTSLMTDASGAQIGETMKYLPFGETRAGAVPTDKKFTGQRLD
ncbi:MAG: hypothetical protein A2144_04365 [Chloroflexi bacterium RBG_16_50_9]|nr:MAG: hypothetical protein A2144_04365 [Chloroflexi bacterium RBG_16_50_9]